MLEFEALDITPDVIDAYYTHGRREDLSLYMSEFICDKVRLKKIVDDVEEATDGYKQKFGVPAPNPMRIMFTPDHYWPDHEEVRQLIDSII